MIKVEHVTKRYGEKVAVEDLSFSVKPGVVTGFLQGALMELTPREREVMLAVSRGLSHVEIAESLVLSEATVKTHVGRILAKLGLRDRVQIVVFAYENGFVTPAVGES